MCTYTNKDLIKYEAIVPNYPRRCILIKYFNESNFSKIEYCAPWWWLHRNMLELF
jgi:hypothetical protein